MREAVLSSSCIPPGERRQHRAVPGLADSPSVGGGGGGGGGQGPAALARRPPEPSPPARRSHSGRTPGWALSSPLLSSPPLLSSTPLLSSPLLYSTLLLSTLYSTLLLSTLYSTLLDPTLPYSIYTLLCSTRPSPEGEGPSAVLCSPPRPRRAPPWLPTPRHPPNAPSPPAQPAGPPAPGGWAARTGPAPALGRQDVQWLGAGPGTRAAPCVGVMGG